MNIRYLHAAVICLLVVGSDSCASKARIPTLQFMQYGLDPELLTEQTKSDVRITLRTIRLADIYSYPQLFSFDLDDFGDYTGHRTLKRMYPEGPSARRWEYPFSTPDGDEHLLMSWVTIHNGTDHILRMGDARIYLVLAGRQPVPALSGIVELLEYADYFEARTNEQLMQESGLFKVQLPPGFYRQLVVHNEDAYRLINDVAAEILPGFTYEGMLVFPTVPNDQSSAVISFFDITTKTDAAGNPVEKTRFDFPLKLEAARMWYDRTENQWKSGWPPIPSETGPNDG